MLIKIPYYSSMQLLERRDNSLFPVVSYENNRHITAGFVRRIVSNYFRNRNVYVYELSIDRKDANSDKDKNVIFTIFLPNNGDCQIKKLKIYVSDKDISFEAVCPRMIPVNHSSIIKLMDKQDIAIQSYWHKLVKKYSSDHETAIGVVQNYLDRPLIGLANYIYSFSEIVDNAELIKSIVGNIEFEVPEFNAGQVLSNLSIDNNAMTLKTLLKEIFTKHIKCDKVPFYANVSESEDIVFGSYGWPYEDEQNTLKQRNVYFLKYFSDWESCLELLFYNMALLAVKGKNNLFGYTTSSIVSSVLKYSALKYRDRFPLSIHSWIDLRICENSVTCQYIVDYEAHRWTLVYLPGNEYSTPSLRLGRLIGLVSKSLIKEFSHEEFERYSTTLLWNRLLAVLQNNIKISTLSSALNTETCLDEGQYVIQKNTGRRLLWHAQRSGMLSVHGHTIEAHSSIKDLPFLDDMAEFSSNARDLIHEIISAAREYNVGFNDIQNVTNLYLAEKIDFSEAEKTEKELKKKLEKTVYPEIEKDGTISNDSVKSLVNYVDDLFIYLISVDYNSYHSDYIYLSDEQKNGISIQQGKIIRCLIAINILLGLYRLHSADKVLSFFETIKPKFLIQQLELKPFEDYLKVHKSDFENSEIINFINKFLESI